MLHGRHDTAFEAVIGEPWVDWKMFWLVGTPQAEHITLFTVTPAVAYPSTRVRCLCHHNHHWHKQTQIGRAAGRKEIQLLTGKSLGYVCIWGSSVCRCLCLRLCERLLHIYLTDIFRDINFIFKYGVRVNRTRKSGECEPCVLYLRIGNRLTLCVWCGI